MKDDFVFVENSKSQKMTLAGFSQRVTYITGGVCFIFVLEKLLLHYMAYFLQHYFSLIKVVVLPFLPLILVSIKM